MGRWPMLVSGGPLALCPASHGRFRQIQKLAHRFTARWQGENGGHGSGHETRQESGVFAVTRLSVSLSLDSEPDIYADI